MPKSVERSVIARNSLIVFLERSRQSIPPLKLASVMKF